MGVFLSDYSQEFARRWNMKRHFLKMHGTQNNFMPSHLQNNNLYKPKSMQAQQTNVEDYLYELFKDYNKLN